MCWMQVFSKLSGGACSQVPTRQSVMKTRPWDIPPTHSMWLDTPPGTMDAIELSYQLEPFEGMAKNNSEEVQL